MSDLLSIGASGVRAYQSALTTVSENIANAGSTGYSRRSTELVDVAASPGSLSSRRALNGQGVVVSGTTRAADEFKASAIRTAGADLARTESGAVWLDRVEGGLSGNALGDRITGFFNAATTLAADPTSVAARRAMLEAGSMAAAAFVATGNALGTAANDLDATAQQSVARLDGLGQALARVNDGLGRTPPGSAAAATLADQRDELLEQMSALSDLGVDLDPAGRATVRLGGGSGPMFVAGVDAGHVTYVRGEEGAVSFAVHRANATAALVPQGGALAGLADGAQRIADARAALDALAKDFGDGVNAVQAAGRDSAGVAGQPMFTVGTKATELRLALTDPAGIAAAAVGGGPRDNANLRSLADFRATAGLEQRLTALTAGNAAALSARRAVAEAQSAIRDNAVAAHTGVTGVDLDAEAVDLLRFQQAYQASSRVIQVARETIQTLLEIR